MILDDARGRLTLFADARRRRASARGRSARIKSARRERQVRHHRQPRTLACAAPERNFALCDNARRSMRAAVSFDARPKAFSDAFTITTTLMPDD